ncbi:hypothetical protein [Eleftheria terrae]|uniref:hypothetical protein n=1 Tax=Eleftheria terrae TaxID=1597781 RepID=UPI00263BA690|nr:hypothetical protein [Eleftheria terrae]WKB52940.1 hypothetical protein N7L95_00625 [Eleftheria terrae]
MKKYRTWLTTVVVLLGACADAAALGLGEARTSAFIGRPLDVTVPVRAEPGDGFSSECVNAEVVLGDAPLPSSSIQLQVSPGRTAGEWVLKLRTLVPVHEPIVTVNVSAGCVSRISRSFVAFADPPPVRASLPVTQADAGSTAEAPAPEAPRPQRRPARPRREPVPAEADAPAAVAAAGPSASAAEPATPPRRPARRRAAAAAAAAPAAPATASAPAAAPRTEARLRLDPLEPPQGSGPSLRTSPELAAAPEASDEQRRAAATAWQALNSSPEQIARELQRVKQLEQQLAQLRHESAQTRGSIDAMRTELQQAARHGSGPAWLTYGLLALSALLALGLLWALRAPGGGPRIWWRPSELAPARGGDDTPPDDDELDLGAEEPPLAPPPLAASPVPSPRVEPPAPVAPAVAIQPPPVAPPLPATQPPARVPLAPRPAPTVAAPAPQREDLAGAPTVSVEELIDLEQQAEFFVALGQEEAAIDLLLGHVSGHPDGSPLPYLKLLEIYQRRGEHEAYERIREQFNERFNAYAPAWEDALADGRSLEDYPTVVSRLQALWETPSRALEVLQASLLRRDSAAQTFDLPAYRELLLLYSVARDRAEGDSPDVDLLLPLEAEGADFSHTMLEPLTATTPVRAYDGPGPSHEVDLPLDLTASGTGLPELPPASPAAAPRSGRDNLIDFEPIELDLPADGHSRPGSRSS